MQDIIPKEEIVGASQRLIEQGVIGAAFFLIFLAAVILIWFVLRSAAKEIRTARAETANANERSAQLATETVKVNTQLVDRQDTVIGMLEKVLDRMPTRS